MKKIKFNKIVLNIMVAMLTVACQGPKGEQGTTGKIGKDGNTSLEMGGYSGGGHEVKENSAPLLEYVKDQLAKKIRNSSDILYTKLPKGWDKKRLSKLVTNVSELPKNKMARRSGLMFDYEVNGEKSTIYATPNYYLTFATFGYREIQRLALINNSEIRDQLSYDQSLSVSSLEISILHEAAHIIFRHDKRLHSSNEELDSEARKFAMMVITALEKDFIRCETYEHQDFWVLSDEMPYELKQEKSMGIAIINTSQEFLYMTSQGYLSRSGRNITYEDLLSWDQRELREKHCPRFFNCAFAFPNIKFDRMTIMNSEKDNYVNAKLSTTFGFQNMDKDDARIDYDFRDNTAVSFYLPNKTDSENFDVIFEYEVQKEYFDPKDSNKERLPIDLKKIEGQIKMKCQTLSSPIDVKN